MFLKVLLFHFSEPTIQPLLRRAEARQEMDLELLFCIVPGLKSISLISITVTDSVLSLALIKAGQS